VPFKFNPDAAGQERTVVSASADGFFEEADQARRFQLVDHDCAIVEGKHSEKRGVADITRRDRLPESARIEECDFGTACSL
jgi:hypothetical protein